MNINKNKKYFLKIYNSSAGTGKTNKLIINYIILLYKYINNINFFSKILVITFTNKTYIEIRNRIIKYLKKLSNKNFFLTKIIYKKFLISYKEINKYSKIILKNININYEKLSIFTIDKFIYKIYKNLNFNNYLLYFNKKNVNYIIKKIINYELYNIFYNKKKIYYKYFKKYIYKNINKGNINFKYNLYKNIKYIFTYNNLLYIQKNKKNFINKIFFIKKKNKKYKKNIINIIKKIKKKFFLFLNKKKIKKKSFIYLDIPKIFNKKININIINNIFYKKKFLNKRLIKNLKLNIFYSKKIKNKQKEKILKYKNKIKKYLLNYEKFLIKISLNYILYNKIINDNIYIFFLYKILNYINKYNFLKNKNKIFNLKQEFLYKYEIIGNLYKIYLIDEFQDISINQWNNLIYLFNNILSEGGKIYFFGDIKQSIYRWRNVNSIKLLKYIKKLYNKKFIKEIYLKKNYRSYYYIIIFNNNLFSYINNFILDKKNKKLYNNNIIQLNNNKNKGYIEINFYKKNIINIIIKTINKLLYNGYKCKDIIILVRKNKDIDNIIKKINNKLIKKKIIISKKFYLLNDIIYIKILIQFLKFFFYKKNIKYRINFIILLEKINFFKKKKINNIINNILKIKNIKNFLKYLNNFNIFISYNIISKLNIYEFFEYLIKKLKFNKNKYIKQISKFLDIVYNYENKNYFQFYDFIIFWKKNKNIFKIYNYNKNIINISTIHQSKGLQFNIVLLPFLEWKILYDKKNIKFLNNIKLYFNFKKKNIKKKIKKFLINNQIDNINILYVATTRAKKKIYFFLKKNNFKNTIYYLFKNFLKNLKIWNKNKKKYYFGIFSKKKKKKKKKKNIYI